MQSLLLSREMQSGARRMPFVFNVVLIYEDFETRERAKKSVDYLGKEFGSDFEFRHSMWRLDILQDPKLNALAAPSLAEAGLLIVSLRCERQLPERVRALIDERLAQIVNPECALVAPFEGSALRLVVRCMLAWRLLRGSTDSTFLSKRAARQKIRRNPR
jgi:hypothetical protein